MYAAVELGAADKAWDQDMGKLASSSAPFALCDVNTPIRKVFSSPLLDSGCIGTNFNGVHVVVMYIV